MRWKKWEVLSNLWVIEINSLRLKNPGGRTKLNLKHDEEADSSRTIQFYISVKQRLKYCCWIFFELKKDYQQLYLRMKLIQFSWQSNACEQKQKRSDHGSFQLSLHDNLCPCFEWLSNKLNLAPQTFGMKRLLKFHSHTCLPFQVLTSIGSNDVCLLMMSCCF